MSCVSVPTATRFSTFTTDSVSTSFSDSVSTLAPTTTTIESVSCVPTSSGNATTSSCSTIQTVSTIDGGATTVQVPVVITIPITSSSPTATLFSTSCTDNGSISNNPPPDTSTTTSSTSTATATTTVVVTTSVATEVTFQTSFTSDGSVVITSGTSTTFVPTSTTETTSVPVATGGTSSGSSDTSAIIGGVVGGVAGAIVLSVVAWFFLRKRRRYDFDDELFLHDPMHDDHTKNVLRKNGGEKHAVPDLDAEPRPYLYGAVGSAGPSSPDATPSTEGPSPLGYTRPNPSTRPSLLPLQQVPSKSVTAVPYPVPPQSSTSTPSVYSVPSQQVTPAATASTSALTSSGGHDQRRPLQVVNDYVPVLPGPPRAGGYAAPANEKAQVYLHPDRGLTTVPERADASGSRVYIPQNAQGGAPSGAPVPGGAGSPPPAPGGPPPQPDPPREPPFVHQDAGRAPNAGKTPDSDAPPAYSE
ncbi:hypothetical protein BD413DRAFT_607713 [Trametes elegans]|nr:hypothetical protein BD413DRAFT_607713 [Trametes elegans]